MTANPVITNTAAIADPDNPSGNSLKPNLDSSTGVITKSNTTTYDPPILALYVGGTGDVAVRMYKDQTVVTISAVPTGAFLPICIDRVMSTNTTATLIVGFF